MTVRILSTIEFGRDWIEVVADDVRVEISEIPAERVDELPGEVLREVEVMYSDSVFPSPDQARHLRWLPTRSA
ncbi:MAG: hypothetical protein ACRDTR_03890 [Rubrobacter sp.]